jgi:two-component system, sensor histidine kinase
MRDTVRSIELGNGSDRIAGQRARDAAASEFDIQTVIALSQRGLFDRVAFSFVYAVISLAVLPWGAPVGWMAAIVIYEWVIAPPLDRLIAQLPEDQAAAVYPAVNLVGSAIYQSLALMCLANGGPLAVVIGATWISGAVLNTFIYFNGARALVLATLAPTAAAAVIGSWLAWGISWNTLIVPSLLVLSAIAARRFSLDHGAVLDQLADRQIAFVDLERKLSIAVEASGDGMFEADIPADQVVVNANWLMMLGYAPGEAPHRLPDWRAFIHPEDVARLEADYQAHFRGETDNTDTELRMICKDGGYKWVLSRARVVARTEDGQPHRMVGTTVDISARKALEHALEAARDEAEAANHSKSVFVANMSHEIRTPLNGVVGIAGALARTELTPVQREMVELVQSSGQMLDRMLSDILDQAKIEAGNFQLQIAPFDLRREVEAAAELMRARADEKGLRFRVDYAEAADGVYEGDAVRLRQVISNLASNAVKFTQDGEVAIRVDAAGSSSAGETAQVRIEIADTGIGFDAETAERLFSRFVQADGSISRQFGGTGLGLAICKTLIQLMDGRITAHSDPGRGSTFSVMIPLTRTVSQEDYRRRARERQADAGASEPSPVLARMRVLLAEDHPTNQRVVQLILEPSGVELMVVDDGAQAVEAFIPGRFDLILMDMQMPVMDGLAATRAIRAAEAAAGAARVPIAMFSANAMDEHLAMAAAAGADLHIAKPITPERLLGGIEAVLEAAPRETLAAAG